MPTEVKAVPDLSVVVVVFAGRSYLLRCLAALMRLEVEGEMELVVPHDDTLDGLEELRARFPGVRLVPLGGQRTYAELRAAGVRAARGRIVAMTEDHCVPDAGWAREILACHEAPHAAVGGAVEKGRPSPDRDDTALSWAVYFTDYSRYMSPVPEGPADYLTDCNVSYKRAVLEEVRGLWEEEFHETTVNWALLDRGERLWLCPRVVVRQQRSLPLRVAVEDRYAFGRLFASTRVASAGLPKRLAYACASALLPALLITRTARTVIGKRRHVGPLLRSLPAMVLTTTVWSWGELLGYLTTRAARSLTPGRESGRPAGGSTFRARPIETVALAAGEADVA
jgi:GT2 family glycosyltransferase